MVKEKLYKGNPQNSSYYSHMNYLDYVKKNNNKTLKMMLIQNRKVFLTICNDETELVVRSATSFVWACRYPSNSSMRLLAYCNKAGFTPESVSSNFSELEPYFGQIFKPLKK